MQSEELLEKTASERLSLEQEYEMQQKWHNDADSELFDGRNSTHITVFVTHMILVCFV